MSWHKKSLSECISYVYNCVTFTSQMPPTKQTAIKKTTGDILTFYIIESIKFICKIKGHFIFLLNILDQNEYKIVSNVAIFEYLF